MHVYINYNNTLAKGNSRDFGVIAEVKEEWIVDQIRTGGDFLSIISEMRALDRNNEPQNERYNYLKNSLWGFIYGIFEVSRSKETFRGTQVMAFDLDDLPKNKVNSYRNKINDMPECRLCFISPGGEGIKFFIQIDHCNTAELYSIAYHIIQDKLGNVLCAKLDDKNSDCSRLTYVSYDPDVYWNPKADIYIT